MRDSRGRSALHVAAAGDSPLMVEYLLTHSRVCLEKLKHSEMQNIKEVIVYPSMYYGHGVLFLTCWPSSHLIFRREKIA